jgi:hypothetical protein
VIPLSSVKNQEFPETNNTHAIESLRLIPKDGVVGGQFKEY